jgi:triosephosphate isomerase
MRKHYLIANWKMNRPPEGADQFVEKIRAAAPEPVTTIVIAPPFPFITQLAASLRGSPVRIGGQSCSTESRGALTGEVSAAMLRDCGATHVLVGHSERRTLFGETNEIVAKKLTAVAEASLVPVLCVGESADVRDRGEVVQFLHEQIAAAAGSLGDSDEIVLAYEPIWAIGTGRNATASVIAETVASIREAVRVSWPERMASNLSVLYGGSVAPENIDSLWSTGAIDGFLVGGASLDSGRFLAILDGMRERKVHAGTRS